MMQDLPNRKQNRLKAYRYSDAGYYFLTVCAKDKKKMFGSVVGGGAFDAPMVQLSEIGRVVEQYILSTNRIQGVRVDQYVIMPNHLHMILVIEETSDHKTRANEQIPHVIGTLKRFVKKKSELISSSEDIMIM